MDLPIIVPLKRPIVMPDPDGITYDVLSFDEPDLGAQIAYAELEATFSDPPSPIDAGRVSRFWIGQLAGIPEAAAAKIKDSDLPAVNAACEAVMGIDKGVGAGGTSGNEDPAK